jgi:RNA recognition motif-containing protein
MVTNQGSHHSRGFGFVEIPDSTEAQVAISELNRTELEGQQLTVNEARPRGGRIAHGARVTSSRHGGRGNYIRHVERTFDIISLP